VVPVLGVYSLFTFCSRPSFRQPPRVSRAELAAGVAIRTRDFEAMSCQREPNHVRHNGDDSDIVGIIKKQVAP